MFNEQAGCNEATATTSACNPSIGLKIEDTCTSNPFNFLQWLIEDDTPTDMIEADWFVPGKPSECSKTAITVTYDEQKLMEQPTDDKRPYICQFGW